LMNPDGIQCLGISVFRQGLPCFAFVFAIFRGPIRVSSAGMDAAEILFHKNISLGHNRLRKMR